ncbi:MAG: glycosyltransferase 87 family protein [Chthoniobacteraceae bacterium]
MQSNPPCRLSPSAIVLIVLGAATAVKTLWAVTSLGTCDSMLFYYFAEALQRRSMALLYEGATVFNHTPLTGWSIRELYVVTHGDYRAFAAVLRLSDVFADISLMLGLLHVRKVTGKPPWWALGLFAASPVSIMVSGFHGNIDPIMVMFLFFSAVAVLKDRPALCGAMFAIACNVKIAPILVAPVFLFYWIGRGKRPAITFMAASGALMLAGASWGLIHCPGAFLRNLFGYGSYWGTWGVTWWLTESGVKELGLVSFAGLTDAQNHVVTALKVITLAGVLGLAWRRRKLGGLEFFTTLGAAFTWIFVFTPGAGVQYMVWFAPFVLLLSPGWWAALTAGSTIYMAWFYQTTAHHFPWDLALPRGPEVVQWGPWTNLVWGTFVALLCCRGASWFLLRKADGAPAPVGNPAPEAA